MGGKIRIHVGLLVLMACAGCSIFMDVADLKKAMTPTPEYAHPRVLEGERSLQKRNFYEDGRIGMVTDLQRGTFYNQKDLELAIVGKSGARFLRADSSAGKTVQFRSGGFFDIGSFDPVVLADIEGDGVPEFLCRGKTANSSAILYNSDGSRRWTYKPFLGVHDSASGDVDGNGRQEVVTAVTTGLDLLNADGKPQWNRADGNVWHVEMADVNGDGKAEILHSNAGGELTIRDEAGKVLLNKRMEIYVSDFSITGWIKGLGQHIVAPEDGAIYVFSFDGKRTARFEAPLMKRLGAIKGTILRPKGETGYFATLMNYELWNRSALYIHKLDGELVFQEILGENCGALTTVPAGETENLIVGCQGRVWEYTPLEDGNQPVKRVHPRKNTR